MGITTSSVEYTARTTSSAWGSPLLTASSQHHQLDRIPADIMVHLSHFLLGTEVMRLSMCSRSLRVLLSGDSIWKHRSPTASSNRCDSQAKQRYCHATSLFFRGSWSTTYQRSAMFDCIPLPPVLFPKQRDISFDMWFALVPPTTTSSCGGVIVGAQDIHASQSGWSRPKASECFAFVDSHRQLHCSILQEKPVVAKNLEYHHWYHLALTYDHTRRQQCVYLNSILIHTMDGVTQFPWLQYAQLGAGFGGDEDSLSHWCGFRGLVDEFRVSYFVWTHAQVQRLARGKFTNAATAYSQSRDLGRGGHALAGSWLEVTCSRPVERYAEITRCWTPRLLAAPRVPSASHQQPRAASKSASTKRSLWQLMRQCL